ncbi:MAG: glycosyltransferase family 2 protein, partial [Bacteroidia bacterium]
MVSVILPFYNSENTLANAIESVLAQSFLQFELILVNNNSDDQSVQVAKKYESLDNRIIIINAFKQGVSHAMNTGLQAAKFELIARIDA